MAEVEKLIGSESPLEVGQKINEIIEKNAVDYNELSELKSGVGSTAAYITETYVNGASWYRVWSDGWCEQGGIITPNSAAQTINLLKTMANTDYTLLIHQSASKDASDTSSGNKNTMMGYVAIAFTLTTSSFGVQGANENGINKLHWSVSGKIGE